MGNQGFIDPEDIGSGSMTTGAAFARGLIALALVGACAPGRTDLVPAATASSASGIKNAAVDSAAGVKITVQSAGWPGKAEIEDVVQPLRVILENRSGRAVLITYDKFALFGPKGRRYSALSPFNIQGTSEDPQVKKGQDPIADPLIIVERFELVPEYGPLYPGVPILGGVLYTDTVYRDQITRTVPDTGLPSPFLLRRALPEGALKDGGRMDGYLFFEKVPLDIAGVSFKVHLVDVADGRVIGILAVPFRVIRKGL